MRLTRRQMLAAPLVPLARAAGSPPNILFIMADDLGYAEDGRARLVSRNGNTYKSFPAFTAAIGAALPVSDAILDGEIVHLDANGVPQFFELMKRRTPQHFCAFDLLWLNGRDLRELPLVANASACCAGSCRPQPALVMYVDHVAATGVALCEAACARDLEGIVAKLASAPYTPEATTWVKIKNPAYSQAEGRADFFEGRGRAAAA